MTEAAGDTLARFVARARRVYSVHRFFARLARGADREFTAFCERIRPDLLLISSTDIVPSVAAIIAYRAGIPCVYLTQDVAALPAQKAARRSRGKKALPRRWRSWPRRLGAMCQMRIDWEAVFDRLTDAYGLPTDLIDRDPYFPCPIKLPHLSLWPKALELPSKTLEHDGCVWGEASIDFSRPEPSFPWERLDPTKALVFCTLGTMTPLKPADAAAFFRNVLIAAAARPTYQLVLGIGHRTRLEALEPLPPGTIVVRHAPQLALLQRAAAIVTSAGPATVREAALLGVPLVVFPYSDPNQLAVAARVAYHGFGVVGDFAQTKPEHIGRLLDAVCGDPSGRIRRASRAMSARLRAMETSGAAVRAVEAWLTAGTPRPRGVDVPAEDNRAPWPNQSPMEST